METCYVAGFMFSTDKSRVALIRKTKPKWQAGLLNGIGGKVEEGERDLAAMVREFEEETGYSTAGGSGWVHFARIFEGGSDPWNVEFFACMGNVDALRSMEEEKLEVVDISQIALNRADMVENLPWLISLAIDSLTDRRPYFTEARYGE